MSGINVLYDRNVNIFTFSILNYRSQTHYTYVLLPFRLVWTADASALHVVVCWWWERGKGRSETDNYKYKATKARMQEARITGSSKQLGLVRTCFCPAEVRPRGNYLHAVGHPSDSDSDLSTPSTHLSIFLNRHLSFSVVFPFCLSLLPISTEFSLSLVQAH